MEYLAFAAAAQPPWMRAMRPHVRYPVAMWRSSLAAGSDCQPLHPMFASKIMPVLDDAEVKRVLVIVAHPDDVDFGAAGTIARWTDAGIEVIYCVVTDGDAGGSDP